MISTRTAVELIIGLILCVTLWVEYNSHEPLEIHHGSDNMVAHSGVSVPDTHAPCTPVMRTRTIYRDRPAESLVSGRNAESAVTGDWDRAEELARMADADRDAMARMASAVSSMH